MRLGDPELVAREQASEERLLARRAAIRSAPLADSIAEREGTLRAGSRRPVFAAEKAA